MPSFLKFSLKIKNLSVQLYLFPVVFFTQQLCFKIFVPPVGKHDQVLKSWHQLQQVSGSLQILNLLKWPSKLLYKSKDSVQASIPSVQAWNKMVQTLHSGCVSAVSMGDEDGITSPAQSTQGKDWAQQEAAQASLWGSQIKSRDQARTERVQMAQKYPGILRSFLQTSESHLCLSTAPPKLSWTIWYFPLNFCGIWIINSHWVLRISL